MKVHRPHNQPDGHGYDLVISPNAPREEGAAANVRSCRQPIFPGSVMLLSAELQQENMMVLLAGKMADTGESYPSVVLTEFQVFSLVNLNRAYSEGGSPEAAPARFWLAGQCHHGDISQHTNRSLLLHGQIC